MHWELEELEKALYNGDIALAKRYVSKLKVLLFCVKCKKKILYQSLDAEPYFKGLIHECCDKSSSGESTEQASKP